MKSICKLVFPNNTVEIRNDSSYDLEMELNGVFSNYDMLLLQPFPRGTKKTFVLNPDFDWGHVRVRPVVGDDKVDWWAKFELQKSLRSGELWTITDKTFERWWRQLDEFGERIIVVVDEFDYDNYDHSACYVTLIVGILIALLLSVAFTCLFFTEVLSFENEAAEMNAFC